MKRKMFPGASALIERCLANPGETGCRFYRDHVGGALLKYAQSLCELKQAIDDNDDEDIIASLEKDAHARQAVAKAVAATALDALLVLHDQYPDPTVQLMYALYYLLLAAEYAGLVSFAWVPCVSWDMEKCEELVSLSKFLLSKMHIQTKEEEDEDERQDQS